MNLTSQKLSLYDEGLLKDIPLNPISTRLPAVPGGGGGVPIDDTMNTSNNSIPPFIPLRNDFDILDDDDNGDGQNGVEQAKKVPKVRLPRIHVMDLSVGDVFKLLNDNGLPRSEAFLLKHTRTSVQFLTKSKEVFDKAVSVLKSKNVKFFTHDSSGKAPSKFVLSGLPLAEVEDVKEELARVNILPRDIKVLSSSKSAVDQHALYLLYFDHGSTKLQDLRKTKALFNVVVSCRYYSRRPNEVAQCHRCQRFGHGSTHCYLSPKCVKCGGQHLTDVCSLPRKMELNDQNNSKSKLKCANCGGSHTANFQGCPSRKKFLDELEKRKKKPVRQPAPNHTSREAFPSLGQQRSGPRTSNFPAGHRTYAQVSATSLPPAPDVDAEGEGLFSISEFLALARDMFARLSGCRSKLQQFNALAELMVKYIYHG